MMLRLPPAFGSDPELFSKIVTHIAELLSQGKVRLRASPSANIVYKVEEDVIAEIGRQCDVDHDSVRKVLGEISGIASLALRSEEGRPADGIMEDYADLDDLDEKDKEETRAAIVEKLRLVEGRLVTDRVREKFHSARASKHDNLVGIRWEVSERKYDKEEGEKAKGSIAIIRFDIASRPELEFFPFPLGLDEFQRRSFIVECDEDDLDDVIDTLSGARARLGKERNK